MWVENDTRMSPTFGPRIDPWTLGSIESRVDTSLIYEGREMRREREWKKEECALWFRARPTFVPESSGEMMTARNLGFAKVHRVSCRE